jgi:glycosyltransferase involved in cell wall biosynthesis
VQPPEPSLLLLIPAYNEEQRIGPVLREFAAYFRDHYHGPFKLIVILNGCRDNTLGVVRQVAHEFFSVGALEFKEPIGKGGALIEGLKLSPLADLVGYVDADGATSPQAFHRLLRLCRDHDGVIGSRWLPGAVLLQSQPWLRRFTSRCFHAIVEVLFRMGFQDTQCPAKVFKRSAIEKIYSQLSVADLSFDVNLLYALKRAGFKVREEPTEWMDKAGSKVTSSLFRSSLTMFLSVVRLRLVYSPFYKRLRWLRPLEVRLYRRLRAPTPHHRPTASTPEELAAAADTTVMRRS